MTELSPEGRQFLDACRDADEPSPPELAGNRGRTLARVGAAAAAGAAVTASTKVAASGVLGAAAGMLGAGKAVLGVVVVVLVGGSAAVAVRSVEGPTPPAAVAGAPRSATVASVDVASRPATVEAERAPLAVTPPEDSPPEKSPEPKIRVRAPEVAAKPATTAIVAPPASAVAAAPVSPDSVAEEVAVLRDARRAMSGGDGQRALEILERHGNDNPGGVLAQERAAMQVVALCQTGKIAEGRAAAARFLAAHPQSPLAARVRGACPSP